MSNKTKSPIAIQELNHVTLYPRDIEKSIDFYENILELKRLEAPKVDYPLAWFALGKQELHIAEDTMNRDKERHSQHFALTIDDVVKAKAHLEDKGVTIRRGPIKRGDGAMQIMLADPDGYSIELVSFPKTPF